MIDANEAGGIFAAAAALPDWQKSAADALNLI